jgi:hypothetical protein
VALKENGEERNSQSSAWLTGFYLKKLFWRFRNGLACRLFYPNRFFIGYWILNGPHFHVALFIFLSCLL